ncbi:SPOR domain-containing protein [Tabrizicola sp.]|uniref:SPOR domain-containing protein n=1 Tax=Tabrizicola sp. TaxID=2005166 RepID=UPI003D28B196
MGFKLLSVAVLAAVFGAASAQAQSVARVGGPANLPPAGFEGQQWVDSRGCVFLKAGYGGQVTWVPRVGRDRRAMCGYPPTGSTRAPLEVASAAEMAAPQPAPQPAPAPRVMAAADPVIAPAPQPSARVAPQPAPLAAPLAAPMIAAPKLAARPAPYVETAPRGGYDVVASAGPSGGQIGCYASAPVAERVKTRNGGTAVVCTRGDGTMTGWRPPVYPRNAGVGAALTDPVMVTRNSHQGHGGIGHSGHAEYATHGHAKAVPTTPPKGYKMAWDDDRLNPNRGKGTAQGWADQDQVWTRKVPSKLVAEEPQAKRKAKAGATFTTSTKGQPATAPVQPKVAKGGAYIQVGTFGVPSNADGAAARLQGIGLPVARAKITSGGKAMQIVLAGPFGSAADAATALSMARRAGFGDAFIR